MCYDGEFTGETNMADEEDIPAFLRVTKEEAERRKLAWINNPPRPLPSFSKPRSVEDPETARVLAEIEEEKKLRAKNRKETKEALRLQKLESTKGKTWDPTHCRWVEDVPPKRSTQERDMTTKGADLATHYNKLVAAAKARGIKAEPTKKFKSIAVGEARIKKLEQQLNGKLEEGTVTPKKPEAKPKKADGLIGEFNKRPGSKGALLLAALNKEIGKQVSNEKLCVAVYGSIGEEPALRMVVVGLIATCPKKYNIVKEKGSTGLYEK